MICTPHLGSRLELCACLTSSMHEVSVTLRLWALHSIQLPVPLLSFNALQSSCSSSTTLRTVVTPHTSPRRRWSVMTSPTSPQNKFGFNSNFLWRKKFSEILQSEFCTTWQHWFHKAENSTGETRCKKSCDQFELYTLLANGKGSTPGCVIKRARGSRVCGKSGACMHTVSKKDLNSDELDIMRISRILRRFWRPTARWKPEKKPRCMRKNWT